MGQSRRAHAQLSPFDWHFHTETPDVVINGRIEAPAGHFVGLRYPTRRVA